MNLIDRIRAAASAFVGNRSNTRRPDWPESLINSLFSLPEVDLEFTKARRLVSTVAKCSELIANDVASLPIVFETGEGENWKPIKRRPGNLVDTWMSANYMDTSFELVRDLSEGLNVHGNAYLFLDGPNPRKPIGLWSLPPQLVTPKVGRGREIEFYEYDRGGVHEKLRPESVIHIRYHNSEDKPIGLSPLESVRIQYETRYDAWRVIAKMMQAGGVANGYFKVPAQNGAPVSVPDADKAAMIRTLKKNFGGIKNVGNPIILDVLEWVKSGLTIEELKVVELSNLSEYDIASRYHIPPARIGLPDKSASGGLNGTGTNASERDYWQSAIKPQVTLVLAVLNERLCPLFGENIRMRADYSQVIALQEPLLQQAQAMSTLCGRSPFTVNEVRAMMGQPRIEDESADALYEAPVPSFGGAGTDPASDPTGDGMPAKPDPAVNDKKPEAKSRMIDGDEVRERARKRANADLRRYERQFAEQFRDVFDAQESRVVAALELQSTERALGSRAISPDDLLAPEPDDEAAIERILAQLVRQRGEAALAEIGLELELAIGNARAAAFIRAHAQRVLTLTTETTKSRLRDSLAQGVSQSEGLSELVARVREVFDNRRANAVTIARTETISAYNFATTEAWAQSGVVEKQEWLSARDNAVRETHAAADGQVVELGKAFDVGGSQLEYPGDPSGDPAEVINCRCTLLPVIAETERKRPQSLADWWRANPNGTALKRRSRIAELVS